MKFRLRGVKRAPKGKVLIVLEMDGGQTAPASDPQRKVLCDRGMWIDGLTRSQAWWKHQWLYGKVTYAVYRTEAEIDRLRKARRGNPG